MPSSALSDEGRQKRQAVSKTMKNRRTEEGRRGNARSRESAVEQGRLKGWCRPEVKERRNGNERWKEKQREMKSEDEHIDENQQHSEHTALPK